VGTSSITGTVEGRTGAHARRRVVIIEDQALLAGLLRDSIGSTHEVVGVHASAEEADAADIHFDAAIVDIHLPGRNGIRWAIDVKRRDPDTGIVVLSSNAYPGLLARIPRSHAEGWAYLLKSAIHDTDQLRRAIEVACDGGILIDPSLRTRARPGLHTQSAGLTDAQWRLLGLLSEGWSNEAIAARLTITPKSVENALGRLYRKLGIDSSEGQRNARVAATRLFLEQGTFPL
jgi:DNA-binding NarL/FixJ family response regulator